MADRIEPSLIARVQSLRETVLERIQEAASPALLTVMHNLDRLAIAIQGGEVDEHQLIRRLSDVAQALERLSDAPPAEVAPGLIAETLPASREGELLARNQRRLVEHTLAQAEENEDDLQLESLQEALVSYARMAPQQPKETSALQRRLSTTVERKLGADLRIGLVPKSDVAALQKAKTLTSSPLQSSILSSGDLQADLARLLKRDFAASDALRMKLESSEMVLAQADVGLDGSIEAVRTHSLVAAAAKQAPTPTAPETAPVDVDEEDPVALAARAMSAHADLGLAKERLEALRSVLAQKKELVDAERRELEVESVRVARLEERALVSRQRLDASQAAKKQWQSTQRLVQDTQNAAKATFRNEVQSIVNIASQVVQLHRTTAQQQSGDERSKTLARALGVESLIGEISGLEKSPSAAGLRSIESQILAVVRAAKSASPGASALLDPLAAALLQHADHAVRASHALDFGAVAGPQPIADAQVPSVLDDHIALDQRARRFDAFAYETDSFRERVLATETELGATSEAARQPIQRARLESPSVQSGSVYVGAIDYKSIQGQADSSLRELKGLQSLHAAKSVDLFSESAGLGVARNAKLAVRSSGDSASLSNRVSGAARVGVRRGAAASNARRFAASAGHLTASDSGRRDLGMATPARFEQMNTPAPLFKRLDRSGEVGRVYLPALYEVSGLAKGPLRKKNWAGGGDPLAGGMALLKTDPKGEGVDLTGANLAVISVVEKYFGKAGRRGEDLAAYGEDPTQGEDYQKEADHEFSRFATGVAEWVSSRDQTLTEMGSAKPRDEMVTGQMDPEALVSTLKSEAQMIPTAVQEKLQPLLGSDLSAVRIYSGPVAGMAAASMGAQAFTLGKHVFFGETQLDLTSAEGLGLLAHELVHTKHFGNAGSVEEKEQEAEAIERRVKKAFGPMANPELALEDTAMPANENKSNKRERSPKDYAVTQPAEPKKGGFKPTYDPNLLVESVSQLVMEWMVDSLAKEQQRAGGPGYGCK